MRRNLAFDHTRAIPGHQQKRAVTHTNSNVITIKLVVNSQLTSYLEAAQVNRDGGRSAMDISLPLMKVN